METEYMLGKVSSSTLRALDVSGNLWAVYCPNSDERFLDPSMIPPLFGWGGWQQSGIARGVVWSCKVHCETGKYVAWLCCFADDWWLISISC